MSRRVSAPKTLGLLFLYLFLPPFLFFVFVLWGLGTCMMYVHMMRVHVLCEGVPGTQHACGSPQPQVPVLTFHLV